VGGTGLGLYWAKKSVELHNGNILYEPARPRGSIFTIELPKM
jgi:signal transduction histidine kinase